MVKTNRRAQTLAWRRNESKDAGRSLRILILSANVVGVGTFWRSFFLGKGLAEKGHDVTLIAVSQDSQFHSRSYYKTHFLGTTEERTDGVASVRIIETPHIGYKWLPGWGAGPLDLLARIVLILRNEFDLIYGFEHHPNVSWPVYGTRLFKRYAFFSDWCDWFGGVQNVFRGVKTLHRIDSFLEERIRVIADLVTSNSSVLLDRARGIGIPGEKLRFIPQGVDCEYIKPVDKSLSRKRLGLPTDFFLLGMGVDNWWMDGIEIFAEVYRRRPDARLLLFGAEPENFRSVLMSHRLEKSVFAPGWVSDEDYPVLLTAADAIFFVMRKDLYDLGRWPGKICDYLATSRPVVINNVGDVARYVKEHKGGIVADSREEMVARIVSLIDHEGERRRVGKQGRKLAAGVLDWKVIGEDAATIVGDYFRDAPGRTNGNAAIASRSR